MGAWLNLNFVLGQFGLFIAMSFFHLRSCSHSFTVPLTPVVIITFHKYPFINWSPSLGGRKGKVGFWVNDLTLLVYVAVASL